MNVSLGVWNVQALKLMNGKPLLGRTIRLSDANAKPAPRSRYFFLTCHTNNMSFI